MDLFTRYHPDLVDQRLHECLARGWVAVADDVVDVRLESAEVVFGQRDGLLVLVDDQLGASCAKAGELGVEVGDALAACLLGHRAVLERCEVAVERRVGALQFLVDGRDLCLALGLFGVQVGERVLDRVVHDGFVRERVGDLLEDRGVELFGGEAVCVADACAVAMAREADVVHVAATVAVGGGAYEALAALRAAQQAGEQVVGLV